MGKASGSHGLSAVGLAWTVRVFGKLSAHVSPEMLEQLANTEGAAKLFAERLPELLADARKATAAALERANEDWSEERSNALRVSDATPLANLGLNEMSVRALNSLARRCREVCGDDTVGDLLNLKEVPEGYEEEFARYRDSGDWVLLRHRLVIQGGVELSRLPDWLQKDPEPAMD